MDDFASGLAILDRMIDTDPNGKSIFRTTLRKRLADVLGNSGYISVHFATNSAKNAVLAARRDNRRVAEYQISQAVHFSSKLAGLASNVATSFILSAEAYIQYCNGRPAGARTNLEKSIRLDLDSCEAVPEISGHIIQSHFNLAKLDRKQFGRSKYIEQLLRLILSIEALVDERVVSIAPSEGFPPTLCSPQFAGAFHGQLSSELMQMERPAVARTIAQHRKLAGCSTVWSWSLAAVEAIGILQERRDIIPEVKEFALGAPSVPLLAIFFRDATRIVGIPASKKLLEYIETRGVNWVW